MRILIKFIQQLHKIFPLTLTIAFLLTTFSGAQQQLVRYSTDSEQSSAVNNTMIDADYTFDEALNGSSIPGSVKEKLNLITLRYYGFDGQLHQGQIVVNKEVTEDIIEIFKIIEAAKFPVEKVVPIVKYDWSDEKSMDDNNTSSFNYRFISGSRILSMHANGLAIDINPIQNPYIKNGTSIPAGSEYRLKAKGTIEPDSEIVKAFKERGWTWGGDWKSLKDYQHFQKEVK